MGLLVVGAGLAVFYLWPVPKVPFQELYAKVNPDSVQSLLAFRRAYPPKRLEIDGAVWDYVVVGNGTKTVLLIHGMTGAYDIWWQQIEALKPNYRIISVTYPPLPSLQEVQKGLSVILKTEGVEEFHLVGTSLGGYIAQYLLVHPPGTIRSVVLCCTFPPNDLIARKNRRLGTLLPFLPEWLVMGFLRRNTEQVVYPASGRDELTLAFLNEMGYGRMRKAHVVQRYRCIIEKFSPATPAVPVLIIESDNDPLIEPSLRKQLKATYPNAEVYTFSGAGHFPYLNRPDEFTRVLKAFWER